MLGHKKAGYIESHGYKAVKTFNPYWTSRARRSKIQTDIGVVLQNACWSP
jgi:hypothetical protein